MSINEIRNQVMPLATGTAINAAAMTGAKAAKQTVLFETRKKAAEKALELRQTPNVKAQTLTKAKNKFYKASDKLRAAKNSKMTKLHNWLEKPFEFFAKGGEKIAAASPKLSKVATDLGTKATTFKPGVWGNIQKLGTKTAQYAVKGGSKVVSGTGSALKYLGKPGGVGKTGPIAGALEAVFRAPELVQGIKEDGLADAGTRYVGKVGGSTAAAVAGAKLGFHIGSKGGFWAGVAGTLAGIGVSIGGSWLTEKGVDLGVDGIKKVFFTPWGKKPVASGQTPPPVTSGNTPPASGTNAPQGKQESSANTLDIQKEWEDLARLERLGNSFGLGYSGAMDYPMMNIYSKF